MTTRITIKDIAKALNIHHSTVSRALRNDARVKKETREIINKYAREHGYQINMSALELRGDKRNTIAVIVPNINHLFFSEIVSHFTNIASLQGYVVSIFQTNENLEREKHIIDTIIKYNFSGVIASVSMESKKGAHFSILARHNIPLVMFDRVCFDIDSPKVVVDNKGIVEEAVYLLHQRGYKRIAHISGSPELNVFGERQKGYKTGVLKCGLNYNKIIVIKKGFVFDDASGIAKDIFKDKEYPEAIICDSSNLLYGLIKEIKMKGLKVPDDIAIITFGESPALEIMEPDITCIVQPNNDIAEATFQLLLEAINGKRDNTLLTLKAKIVIRESI